MRYRYLRPLAVKRACQSSLTGAQSSTATASCIRWAFRAFITVRAGQSLSRSTWQVWPVAWTPVSVRPAAAMRTVWPEKAVTAVSIAPCTVGWPAWA